MAAVTSLVCGKESDRECAREKDEEIPYSNKSLRTCSKQNWVENIVTYHLHTLHERQSDRLVPGQTDHAGRSLWSGLQQCHHRLHTHSAALEDTHTHTVRSSGVCEDWGGSGRAVHCPLYMVFY